MTELTPARYEAEVNQHADALFDELDNSDLNANGITILSGDIIDGHSWFSRKEYGSALYGAVIEHSESELRMVKVVGMAMSSSSPRDLLKRMAARLFQLDVEREANKRAAMIVEPVEE